MAYVDPKTVVCPKANWSLIKVLRFGDRDEKGEDNASLAVGNWDSFDDKGPRPVFAMRWNGSGKDTPGVGNPQSRGLPTWFIVPDWMQQAIFDSGLIPEADMPFVTSFFSSPPAVRN